MLRSRGGRKRKGGTLPDPRVFQQLPISQAATFDVVREREADGDVVRDPDGMGDVAFQKLKLGQKVVETITVKPIEDLYVLDDKYGYYENAAEVTRGQKSKFAQFAVNFPYSQATTEFYKKAIKVGKNDYNIVLPKIHRIETVIKDYIPEIVSKDLANAKFTDNTAELGIAAIANDEDMREKFKAGFWRGRPAYTADNRKKYPTNISTDGEKDAPRPADELLIRHNWKPLYIKTIRPEITSKNLYKLGTEKAVQGTASIAYRGDSAQQVFYNEKKLPLQLWEPCLYLGVITGHRNEHWEVEFKIEYSYEEIDGTDFFYRQNGWVDQKQIQSIYNKEPSKVFYINGMNSEVDKYDAKCMVHTQRLKIYETITNDITSKVGQDTPTPAYIVDGNRAVVPEVAASDSAEQIEQMMPNPFDVKLPNPFKK